MRRRVAWSSWQSQLDARPSKLYILVFAELSCEGVKPEELRHVMLLAIATLGLPAAVKALTWMDDIGTRISGQPAGSVAEIVNYRPHNKRP
jgi:hypothetical protein